MAKGSREIYKFYKGISDTPVDYKTFKDIIVKFNCGIVDNLLEGGIFNMGNKLSTLSIWRRKRDPRTMRVNWQESLAYKEDLEKNNIKLYDRETGEGEKWLIYLTDSHYFRYRWHKDKCMVKNKTVYRFDPTRGEKGNKEKLTKLIKGDDLAYLRFKEYKNGNL